MKRLGGWWNGASGPRRRRAGITAAYALPRLASRLSQGADQDRAGVRRVDDVVDLERRRGAQRLAPLVVRGHELVVPLLALGRVGDRVQFPAVAQPDRSLQAH